MLEGNACQQSFHNMGHISQKHTDINYCHDRVRVDSAPINLNKNTRKQRRKLSVEDINRKGLSMLWTKQINGDPRVNFLFFTNIWPFIIVSAKNAWIQPNWCISCRGVLSFLCTFLFLGLQPRCLCVRLFDLTVTNLQYTYNIHYTPYVT